MAKNKHDRETQTVAAPDVGAVPTELLDPPATNLPAVPEPPKASTALAVSDETAEQAAFKGHLANPEDLRIALPMITTVAINHPERKLVVNGELVDFIEGYPLKFFQMRGYWAKAYKPGNNEPPDCHSNDMKVPADSVTNKQSDKCGTCKKAQFGSSPNGRGQACKTTTLLFIGNPAEKDDPIKVMFLPPTSIKALMGNAGRFPKPGYLQLVQAMKDTKTGKKVKIPQLAWTRWGVAEAAEDSIHALLDPHFLHACPSLDEASALATLINDNKEAMEAFRGDVTVLAGEED